MTHASIRIAILFHSFGGYHHARLRGFGALCQQMGWQLTAIQVTDQTQEHPWGQSQTEDIPYQIITLLPQHSTPATLDTSFNSPHAAQALLPILHQLQPQILAIPGWGFPISQTMLKWGKQHRAGCIVMSESKADDAPRQWWKEILKSLLYIRRYDAALVGSQAHADYLAKLGLSAQNIFFGYDIVDNGYFIKLATSAKTTAQAIRSTHPQIPPNPYFIAVTRFIPRKNLIRLLEAYCQYRAKVSTTQAWNLVLCGSGVEESAIRSFIQANQLNHWVHLPGFLTYDQIPAWYGLASAFIHPALQEQWGLVVNEAMASGLPVLVSNRCGCFPELVQEGITGYGFDPEKTDQICDLMLKISSDQVDRAAMGKAAQEHIQNFSPEHFAQGLKRAIDVALANKI